MGRIRLPLSAIVAATSIAGLPAAALAQRPAPSEAGVLRVCADPNNLPVSDSLRQGFENKIAQLIADTWHSDLRYVWWPARFGYFNRGLNGLYCDIEITAPVGLDIVATTRPYYRSAYVIVYRKDTGLNITSLSDPQLKKVKIGVQMVGSDGDAGPPAAALKSHGVVGLVGFSTFFSEINHPEDIINAVADKKVDVAIVWGPVAGYFAAKSPVPLVMNPILSDSANPAIPFSYPIAMAVARRNKALRDSLQAFLDQHHDKLEGILRSYGVPLFPLADSTRSAASPAKDSSAGGNRTNARGR